MAFSFHRIQQRNGRKTLTTVQGLSADYDLKKIVRACKKEFACNGTIVEHSEYGEVSKFINMKTPYWFSVHTKMKKKF